MKAEYEFMDFANRIKLEIGNIQRKALEHEFNSVSISFINGVDIPVVNIWAKDHPNGDISACHSVKLKNDIFHEYTVSQYNEATGNWLE